MRKGLAMGVIAAETTAKSQGKLCTATGKLDSLESEWQPIVRAVVGHWLFGFIHPYMDGNGRMARFLMNLMMASGGYPRTIVRTTRRKQYLDALEAASAPIIPHPGGYFNRSDFGEAGIRIHHLLPCRPLQPHWSSQTFHCPNGWVFQSKIKVIAIPLALNTRPLYHGCET